MTCQAFILFKNVLAIFQYCSIILVLKRDKGNTK
ncbi:hypothetical protein [Salmonella phage PHA46]